MPRKINLKHFIALIKLALVCVLATSATLAVAGQGTSADELLSDADRVLQQFDSGQYVEAWQDAAPFVKVKIPQNQFVGTMSQSRRTLGAVTRRGWSSVTRIQYVGVAGVPDGLYANVDFTSTLGDGRTAFELLSFQLGNDGRWHLTGYTPRLTQATTTVPISTP
jgi:hypothetical protein